ncbi:MAG: bifunctional trypsin-like peptidase domain-containing/SEL1-like repeat protein [Deltaproteobacteria bacterium]|nr:bifunctional trypsin-like peptidase domain-containing/SEL1-like repeat protein [Deltaproteobacteria bacterium]
MHPATLLISLLSLVQPASAYLFNHDGHVIPDMLADSKYVAWNPVRQALGSARNGVGHLYVNGAHCTGTLLDTGGNPASAPAYVLTAGHCLRRPGKTLGPFDVVVDAKVDGRFELNAFADVRTENRRVVKVRRFAYATMNGSDLGVVELDATRAQLAAEGYRFSRIATDAREGSALELLGVPAAADVGPAFHVLHRANCVFQHNVYRATRVTNLERQAFRWDAAILHDCSCVGGMSGGPLFVTGTDSIAGVASAATSLEDVMETFEEPRIFQFDDFNLASRASPAVGCFAEDGTFTLKGTGCTLPEPCDAERVVCARRACERGIGRGCHDAGRFDEGCRLGDARSCGALGASKQACAGGDAASCFVLGRSGEHSYFENACRKGHGPSCAELAGEGDDLHLWAKACFHEDAPSCELIARVYEQGLRGVPRSPKAAVELYKAACEFGSESACKRSGKPARRGD